MVEKAKRKRAATVAQAIQAKKRRRCKGTLKGISDMPMEIVYKILSYLHPADLISLSRTTKPLRSLLMSRESSELVWKTCRENVPGFPNCPADLSEPQYAELAFGKACRDCGRNHINNVIAWHARTRLCTKCLRGSYIPESDLPLMDDDFKRLLPCALKDGSWFFEHDTLHLWITKMMNLDNPNSVAWLAKMSAQRMPIIQHADACHVWEASMSQAAFEERLSEVKARVRKLDHRGEFDRLQTNPRTGAPLEDPLDATEIRQICFKKLGPKAWEKIDSIINSKISVRFLLRAEAVCQGALNRAVAIRDEIVRVLPQVEPYIPLIDLITSPGYGEIFAKYLSDSTTDPSQDGKVLEMLPKQFLDYHTNWVERNTKRIFGMTRQAFAHVPSPGQDPTSGIDPDDHQERLTFLKCATIFFRCRLCCDTLRYSNVLAHGCAYQWGAVEVDDPLSRMIFEKTDSLPWNRCNVIFFEPCDFFAANNFVKYCNLDPETAEMEDLDVCTFVCWFCAQTQDPPARLVMLGSRALYHCIERRWDPLAISAHEGLWQKYSEPGFFIGDFSTAFRPIESDMVRSHVTDRFERARKAMLPSDDVDPAEYQPTQWRVCCTQCPVTGSSSTMDAHARTLHADVDVEACLKICRGDFRSEFVLDEVWVPLSL